MIISLPLYSMEYSLPLPDTNFNMLFILDGAKI
jgi:hypothetical protein